MNQIRAIQALNKREIENGVPPEASWHVDYRDTAFIYFGGLPYEMSEGDVITVFSQFGEPVFLKLARDKETGKSKGFGWLKYEDQRSTDLAVDNFGGAEINGRLIRVDHARYKLRDDEDIEESKIGWQDMLRRERVEKGLPSETEEESEDEEKEKFRPVLKEERELQLLIAGHDDEDPMKEFLIEEKKKEVEEARLKEKRREEKRGRKHKEKDRHRSHRSRREGSDGGRRRERSKSRERTRARDDRDDYDSDRKHRPRRERSPREKRRDSRDRDRDDYKRRDRDEYRRYRDDENKRSRADGDRGKRGLEDRTRRDRHRSRSRSKSPRYRRD